MYTGVSVFLRRAASSPAALRRYAMIAPTIRIASKPSRTMMEKQAANAAVAFAEEVFVLVVVVLSDSVLSELTPSSTFASAWIIALSASISVLKLSRSPSFLATALAAEN